MENKLPWSQLFEDVDHLHQAITSSIASDGNE
jgi:hypothetical protein